MAFTAVTSNKGASNVAYVIVFYTYISGPLHCIQCPMTLKIVNRHNTILLSIRCYTSTEEF